MMASIVTEMRYIDDGYRVGGHHAQPFAGAHGLESFASFKHGQRANEPLYVQSFRLFHFHIAIPELARTMDQTAKFVMALGGA
jgi:hypothetical protein